MKYITVLMAALFCAVFVPKTNAATDSPYFLDLGQHIAEQITVSSNTVPVNKKLISQLKAALKTLDKTKSNSLADETKTLQLVVPMLNKTSVSNLFDAELQFILDVYTTNYTAVANHLADQLAKTFPGKKQDAAQKALNKLLAAIQAADTNFNSTVAAKALAAASKSRIAAEKAVLNAQNAKLPPTAVTATISVPGEKVVKFSSKLAVAPAFVGGNFVVNAVSTTGSGFNTKVQNLTLILPNLVEGANSVVLTSDGNHFTTGGLNGNTSFIATGGSAQVVWISGSKAIAGTFTFNATEQNGSRTATITGSFTAQYQ